jgi:phosphatidylcholine synthase
MSRSATSRTATGENLTRRRILAWGVHLFTASGAVAGALALVAIAADQLAIAALLMLLTLAIDAVDGTLARVVGVAQLVPRIDGRRLDDIVDYLNYVIVPSVFMVAAGSLLGWAWIALPVLSSAYGFSQRDAKTDDDFFLGWPSYWNVVAVYLWLLDAAALSGTLAVAFFAIAVFVPLKYVYPSRMSVLKRTTTALGVAWLLALAAAIALPETAARIRLVEISLSYPAYYLVLSFWLGGLRRT